MKVGIVGFAGSGKTTIFNALTGLSAATGFGSKERANLGMIKVPDPRVEKLAEIYKPKKKTLAEIGFVDVAGPAPGASERGLETRIVSEMRVADALVHVVRAFDNPSLSSGADPLRDLTDFEGEIVLTDLIQVEGRLERMRKEGKKSQERTFFEQLHAQLDAGEPLRVREMSEQEQQMISGFRFLSVKPCVVVVSQPDDASGSGPLPELREAARERGLHLMTMAGRAEAEIAELPVEEQKAFLEDLGLAGSARDRFVQTVFAELDLITFLTRGEDECRAWPIKNGTNARRAAGKIHSDIERGFIRAEVTAWEDFEKHPSESQARDAGVMRVEGKDYVVKDGDLINFRFNV